MLTGEQRGDRPGRLGSAEAQAASSGRVRHPLLWFPARHSGPGVTRPLPTQLPRLHRCLLGHVSQRGQAARNHLTHHTQGHLLPAVSRQLTR